jgi:tRNA(Ile2) C34 agmatinyltransferase TiaS
MPRCPSCRGDVQTRGSRDALCPACGASPAVDEDASTAPILEELPADGPTE